MLDGQRDREVPRLTREILALPHDVATKVVGAVAEMATRWRGWTPWDEVIEGFYLNAERARAEARLGSASPARSPSSRPSPNRNPSSPPPQQPDLFSEDD